MPMGLGLGLGLSQPKVPMLENVEKVSGNLEELLQTLSDGSDFANAILDNIKEIVTNDFCFDVIEKIQISLEGISQLPI